MTAIAKAGSWLCSYDDVENGQILAANFGTRQEALKWLNGYAGNKSLCAVARDTEYSPVTKVEGMRESMEIWAKQLADMGTTE